MPVPVLSGPLSHRPGIASRWAFPGGWCLGTRPRDRTTAHEPGSRAETPATQTGWVPIFRPRTGLVRLKHFAGLPVHDGILRRGASSSRHPVAGPRRPRRGLLAGGRRPSGAVGLRPRSGAGRGGRARIRPRHPVGRARRDAAGDRPGGADGRGDGLADRRIARGFRLGPLAPPFRRLALGGGAALRPARDGAGGRLVGLGRGPARRRRRGRADPARFRRLGRLARPGRGTRHGHDLRSRGGRGPLGDVAAVAFDPSQRRRPDRGSRSDRCAL